MIYSYVLKLEGGKYFIGRTCNPYFTFLDHFPNEWTNENKPLSLIEFTLLRDVNHMCKDTEYDVPVYDNTTEFLILQYYLKRYSMDNVRHLLYPKIICDEDTYNFYKRIIVKDFDSRHFCNTYYYDKDRFNNKNNFLKRAFNNFISIFLNKKYSKLSNDYNNRFYHVNVNYNY